MSTFALSISQMSIRRATTAVVFGCLAVGAWASSIGAMSRGHAVDRLSVGSLGFFVVLWVVMMAAMMFPSFWPAVAIYRLVARRRTAGRAQEIGRSAMFVAGYLGSWTVFGLGAFGLLWLARSSGLGTLSGVEFSRFVIAPVALLAALYQVAPFKRVCLRHCRGPLSFFLRRWQDGPLGAARLGARHGSYCVGCCWMLMLVLLAFGVMSVTWMVVVSVAIAIEKLTPGAWSRWADRGLTAGLVVVFLISIVEPTWLPGGAMAGGGAM
jgi:predicted metal-binding membrane protein